MNNRRQIGYKTMTWRQKFVHSSLSVAYLLIVFRNSTVREIEAGVRQLMKWAGYRGMYKAAMDSYLAEIFAWRDLTTFDVVYSYLKILLCEGYW